jgi:hypothetical protein
MHKGAAQSMDDYSELQDGDKALARKDFTLIVDDELDFDADAQKYASEISKIDF